MVATAYLQMRSYLIAVVEIAAEALQAWKHTATGLKTLDQLSLEHLVYHRQYLMVSTAVHPVGHQRNQVPEDYRPALSALGVQRVPSAGLVASTRQAPWCLVSLAQAHYSPGLRKDPLVAFSAVAWFHSSGLQSA